MSAALVETVDLAITPPSARAEASRANGRQSRGPVSDAGKAASRQNSCRDGLTGAGVVLPTEAAEAVARLEADFADCLQPADDIERDLVRQMALGTWRRQELARRVDLHDFAYNRARFARWEDDQDIEAEAIGRTLADDPPTAVARLRRTSAGCAWLIARWQLLANAVFTADDGFEPHCTWTDADLGLAIDLFGRSPALRRLDGWAEHLGSLRQRAHDGEPEAAAALAELIADQIATLEAKCNELFEWVDAPQLSIWRQGLDVDLGPEAARLRRYEAAADRLYRTAFARLERLRRERNTPLLPAPTPDRDRDRDRTRPAPPPPPAPVPVDPPRVAAPPPPPRPSAPASSPSRPLPPLFDTPEPSPLFAQPDPILDLCVGRPPRRR